MKAVRATLPGNFFSSSNTLLLLEVCTLVCFFSIFLQINCTVILSMARTCKHFQVRMSIEYGISPLSVEAFLLYAWIVCIAFKEDLRQAREWGHLSMRLVEKLHTHIKLSNSGRVWFLYCSTSLLFSFQMKIECNIALTRY